MKYAIAGSWAEYKDYLRQTHQTPTDIHYVSRYDDMRGIRGELIVLGSYYNSPAFDRSYLKELQEKGYLSITYYHSFYESLH